MHDFCLTIPYGIVVGIGGIFGYFYAGSTMSLLGGCTIGGGLTFIGYCSLEEFKQSPMVSKTWSAISLGLTASLTGIMSLRYNKTGVFFPAGLIAASGGAMSLFYIVKLLSKNKPHYKKKK